MMVFSGNAYLVEKTLECHAKEMRRLYLAGDWWEPEWNDEILSRIVSLSFAFVVATDPDGQWIGMGRIISDGISDAYLQDIVVLPGWRDKGVGSAIVKKLLDICKESGIGWIGVIAGPETEFFYRKFNLFRMGGYTPMRYEG